MPRRAGAALAAGSVRRGFEEPARMRGRSQALVGRTAGARGTARATRTFWYIELVFVFLPEGLFVGQVLAGRSGLFRSG